MKRIGIVANARKPIAGDVLERLARKAQERGLELVCSSETAGWLPDAQVVEESEISALVDVVMAMGGDGTMLRTIRSEWRRRLPFYGINAGHMGFLLNEKLPATHLGREVVLEQLPLLKVETESENGSCQTALAFNDAWVERATGQTAWLQVTINGQQRLPQLVADGALIATAAGSTSYARAMGAHSMPLNTPALLLVGSNVLTPTFWQPAVLPLDSLVEIRTLDPDKRPLVGYIDGISQGRVVRMQARVSQTASLELAFDPSHDPAEKLARIQFPLAAEE